MRRPAGPTSSKAARGAFAYEDTLFDAKSATGADLRLPPRAHSAFARAWCHGAPGIALARLRAAALDPDRRDAYLAMARDGLATTLDAIEDKLVVSEVRCDVPATACRA